MKKVLTKMPTVSVPKKNMSLMERRRLGKMTLSMASIKTTSANNSDIFNQVCVNEEASGQEKLFHEFLDSQDMNELNISNYLRSK